MSNWGPYQEITTRAGQLGGVDALVLSIEKSAVLKAAPKLVGLGVIGTLGAVGAVYVGVKKTSHVRHRWEQHRAGTINSGEQAKTDLTDLLDDEDIDSDGADSNEQTERK